MKVISPCLLFVGEQAGKAEEAVTFYTSLFENSSIGCIEHYGADEEEPEGMVKIARFTLKNVKHIAMDSALNHKFNFTPSMSLFVECDSMEEIKSLYQALVTGGSELVPLDDHSYSYSRYFGWLNDQFGVSWQLNLT